jgi:sulfur-carrier protein adenylyltransferase/sulfurtransferase
MLEENTESLPTARTGRELVELARREIQEIDAAALQARLDAREPLHLIDIREPDEWARGHIPGAALIPRGNLEFRIDDEAPDRGAPVVLYCSLGLRSALSAQALQRMGYRRVVSLVNGFERWKGEGRPVVVPRALRDEQRIRYARHLMLDKVGEIGQARLLEAKVLIVGAGGLGSPAALYLAAAGVGTIGLVDADVVDLSNLQRQVLYRTGDVGAPKAERAAEALRALNPDVTTVAHPMLLTSDNATEILAGYDVVINGSDNFPTRYLVNDAAVMAGLPVVDGSIYQFEGRVTVYAPARGGPCYRCLQPRPPRPGDIPSCADAGVLGVLPGIIGSLQAAEALKLILGVGRPLIGRLLIFEALTMTFDEVPVSRDPTCPVCGDHPTITKLIDYELFCGLKS